MYCSAMWFDTTKSAMKKLKVAYNNSVYADYYLCLPTIVPVKCLYLITVEIISIWISFYFSSFISNFF